MGNLLGQFAGLVASMGASEVVTNIIKSTTPGDLNKYKKGLVMVGSIVIGGMAGEAAAKYVDRQITEIKTAIHDMTREDDTDEGEQR